MSDTEALRIAHTKRVLALSKMSKLALIDEYNRVIGKPIYTRHDISRWSKDELIADILRSESRGGSS